MPFFLGFELLKLRKAPAGSAKTFMPSPPYLGVLCLVQRLELKEPHPHLFFCEMFMSDSLALCFFL